MTAAANMTEQQIAQMARLAVEIADRAAIADLECEALGVQAHGGVRWYDVRPMLDEREHAPQSIDMAREAIDYLLLRHLVEPHPEHAHLLRITRRP